MNTYKITMKNGNTYNVSAEDIFDIPNSEIDGRDIQLVIILADVVKVEKMD